MFGFFARNGSKALAVAFLVASVPLDRAFAGSYTFNGDFQNNTGSDQNELDITLHSTSFINVTAQYVHTSPESPSVAFTLYLDPGNNTKSVELQNFGATIPNGYWTHVGASYTATTAASAAPAVWKDITFMSRGIPFPSVNFVNPLGVDFGVIRATMYSAPINGSVIGHLWYEGPVDAGTTSFASLFNANLEVANDLCELCL